MFEKILVCLDGSNLAEQILPYATEEALHFNSKLVLFQVVTLPSVVVPGIPGVPGAPVQTVRMLEQSKKEEVAAKTYLNRVARPLRKRGIKMECVTLQGMAGEAIVDYAEKNKIGLIAIATHGRSGLRRAVFGSVADFVLRESRLPILIIRPEEPAT